jgi:hypothetical protein
MTGGNFSPKALIVDRHRGESIKDRHQLNYRPGGWKENAMATEIVALIVGFVLTSVLGGLLGTYFQRRTWEHQHDAQLREQELERASQTCYSLSVLLDRRLYRMVRLQRAIARCQEGGFTRDDVETRFRAYDEVLFEWNDALNGNLAVMAPTSASRLADSSTTMSMNRLPRPGSISRTPIGR